MRHLLDFYRVGLALSLTCREFAGKALPLLYQHLLIRNTHASRVLVTQLERPFLPFGFAGPYARGTCVKSIEFIDCEEGQERRRRLVDKQYTLDYNHLFKSFAYHAIRFCPNLTTLHFSTAPYPPTKWALSDPEQEFYLLLFNLPPPSLEPLTLVNVAELSIHGRSQTPLHDVLVCWRFPRLRSLSLGTNVLVNNRLLRAHGNSITRLRLSIDGDVPLTRLSKLCPDLHVLVISDESKEGIRKKRLANLLMGHNTLFRFTFLALYDANIDQEWMNDLISQPSVAMPKLKRCHFQRIVEAAPMDPERPGRHDSPCRMPSSALNGNNGRSKERRRMVHFAI